jgi:hypothetical protein
MKPETDPITEDEFLLRRVRVEQFRTDQVPVISPNAFEPRIRGRDPDLDGISLYRESCLNSPMEILATVPEVRIGQYGIVRIPVHFLGSIGLSIRSEPDTRILGHVVIPELNSTDYEADKAKFTAMKLRLAEKASESTNIVLSPTENNAG